MNESTTLRDLQNVSSKRNTIFNELCTLQDSLETERVWYKDSQRSGNMACEVI